jgi:hypothetical protein
MNYRIGKRLFHEIPSDNGSKELVAYDGKPISNAEWEAFCAMKVAYSQDNARVGIESKTNRALAYMATLE